MADLKRTIAALSKTKSDADDDESQAPDNAGDSFRGQESKERMTTPANVGRCGGSNYHHLDVCCWFQMVAYVLFSLNATTYIGTRLVHETNH